MHEFDPDWVVPTSEVLEEWLTTSGLSVRVAVARLPRADRELAAGYLQNVLDGKEFTRVTADVLAVVTGISADFWMAFEHNYRAGLAAGKTVFASGEPK